MKITVKVQPRAKKEEVIHEGENRYRVRVAAPPVEGKANERVIELLAEYFDTAKRNIVILRGESGREKLVEIVGKR
jgi:uncharacterized protein (TIGR00251 family)